MYYDIQLIHHLESEGCLPIINAGLTAFVSLKASHAVRTITFPRTAMGVGYGTVAWPEYNTVTCKHIHCNCIADLHYKQLIDTLRELLKSHCT